MRHQRKAFLTDELLQFFVQPRLKGQHFFAQNKQCKVVCVILHLPSMQTVALRVLSLTKVDVLQFSVVLHQFFTTILLTNNFEFLTAGSYYRHLTPNFEKISHKNIR